LQIFLKINNRIIQPKGKIIIALETNNEVYFRTIFCS